MKMYGVFTTVRGFKDEDEKRIKTEESDKEPLALYRYADAAQKLVKEYDEGKMEVREVDVTAFSIIVRRSVSL